MDHSNQAKKLKKEKEKIQELLQTSYQAHDDTLLREAISKVEGLNNALAEGCLAENGLPIRSSPKKKKFKTTSVEYHQVFYKPKQLPPKRRWKKKAVRCIDLTDEDSSQVGPDSKQQTISTGCKMGGVLKFCVSIALWPQKEGKNSVHNLPYGPRTRLIRGIYLSEKINTYRFELK